jgi:hypothetical protein
VERDGVPVGFGVNEYTLVFKRAPEWHVKRGGHRWEVLRPTPQRHTTRRSHAERDRALGVPHLLVVPIYSTLALDALAYERFLLSSGALDAALRVLGQRALSDPFSAETTRKKIQSLVMAAEVQHIVDGMSA